MSTCPEHIVQYMHEYLDGYISREHEQELRAHMRNCKDCQKHMQELTSTIAFVKSAAVIEVPPNFVEQVTKQPNLQVEGQTVIVPEGKTVKGDIVVKNGDIVVKGAVDGNITVINGKYMASTANVTGQIEEVDEVFEWLWYKIKSNAKSAWSFIDKNE